MRRVQWGGGAVVRWDCGWAAAGADSPETATTSVPRELGTLRSPDGALTVPRAVR
ncbi:hypothetical protein [Streptomyces mirabilis]|uniref:hypothetical protein n=1 Tax=Streptomyces mirabilis TaxID=68239 RepID=UPI00369EEAFF